MGKSKKKSSAPAPPLPPWQRLHKPVAPAKTAEEIEAEKSAAAAAAAAAKEAAAKAPPAAVAGAKPTDHPSNGPNQKKPSGVVITKNDPPVVTAASLKKDDSDKDSISGEINNPPRPAGVASKNKKPPSKKSNGNTFDSDDDSDDEPVFNLTKAVKCPRTSVSAEAYSKRLHEKEEGGKKRGGGKAAAKNDVDAASPPPPPPRRGKRDRANNGGSHNNDASADDIDAFAMTVAESAESIFDVAAAVAKMPPKKKPAKSKVVPKKASAPSAKASKKTAAKSAAKKPAAAVAASPPTGTKRSARGKASSLEGYLNALENGLDEEDTSSSPQRSSQRQRTQVEHFTISDAPASSAAHGEHVTEDQVAPAKKSSNASKKRKAAEPAAATKQAKKVAKKNSAPKKAAVAEEDDKEEAYLPPISPRAQHVTAKMEATWNERMKMLREHKAKYGTTDLTVAEKGDVDQLLRSFVFEQRKQHKKYMSGKHSSLTAERVKKLSDMGFEFDPMSSGTHKANAMRRFQQQWDEMYDELVQFKNVHGNTLVPLGKQANDEVSRCLCLVLFLVKSACPTHHHVLLNTLNS